MKKVLSTVALCLVISLTQAATYTITNTNDSGPGSLRWAIGEANTDTFADTIEFHIPTSDPGYDISLGVWWIWPRDSLPTLTDTGTYINGWTQTTNQGDLNPYGPEIVICGDSLDLEKTTDSINGLSIVTSYCKITGLAVCGFPKDGILINEDVVYPDSAPATRNVVLGCYIGTDPLGEIAHLNGRHGINIFGGLGNIIGGPDSTQRNLISGNKGAGIRIDGDSNVVINNYIGSDRNGTDPLGNGFKGVDVFHSIIPPEGSYYGRSIANRIGGCGADSGNVIVANKSSGVYIYLIIGGSNRVMGNWIGTDKSCTKELGNGDEGVHIHWCNYNQIGDTISGAGNVVVNNGSDGIYVREARYNIIRGNWIGTCPDTLKEFGNEGNGVYIDGLKPANPTQHNTIGPGNFIWNNDSNGVLIKGHSPEDSTTYDNTITKNSITNNGLKGIELLNMGNWEINSPVIEGVSWNDTDSIVVEGSALPFARVEVFTDPAEEGKWPHCFTTADRDGDWTFVMEHPQGAYVTATATDTFGNASEFSDSVLGIEEEAPVFVDRGIFLETYPNPSLHGTVIFYELPKAGEISLVIYDAGGRLIRTLVARSQQAGYHTVHWNGKDNEGRRVPSGVYFCYLKLGDFTYSEKTVLIK